MTRLDSGDEGSPRSPASEHKKKLYARRKIEGGGVWPCRIDGCNKQFAREADLKRHQRTTKAHSTAGFARSACPQCDASFTRPDALKRHQKSRHNGVVIEPDNPLGLRDDGSDYDGMSMSSSRSPSPHGRRYRERSYSPPRTYMYYNRYYDQAGSSTAPRPVMDPKLAQALPRSGSPPRLGPTSDWSVSHPPWNARYATQGPPRPYPPAPLYFTPYQHTHRSSHSRATSYGESSSSRAPGLPISNSRSTERIESGSPAESQSAPKSSEESKSESPAPTSPPQWQRRPSYDASVRVRDSAMNSEEGEDVPMKPDHEPRIRDMFARDVTQVAMAGRDSKHSYGESDGRRRGSASSESSASEGEPEHELQYARRPPPPRQLAHLLTEDGGSLLHTTEVLAQHL